MADTSPRPRPRGRSRIRQLSGEKREIQRDTFCTFIPRDSLAKWTRTTHAETQVLIIGPRTKTHFWSANTNAETTRCVHVPKRRCSCQRLFRIFSLAAGSMASAGPSGVQVILGNDPGQGHDDFVIVSDEDDIIRLTVEVRADADPFARDRAVIALNFILRPLRKFLPTSDAVAATFADLLTPIPTEAPSTSSEVRVSQVRVSQLEAALERATSVNAGAPAVDLAATDLDAEYTALNALADALAAEPTGTAEAVKAAEETRMAAELVAQAAAAVRATVPPLKASNSGAKDTGEHGERSDRSGTGKDRRKSGTKDNREREEMMDRSGSEKERPPSHRQKDSKAKSTGDWPVQKNFHNTGSQTSPRLMNGEQTGPQPVVGRKHHWTAKPQPEPQPERSPPGTPPSADGRFYKDPAVHKVDLQTLVARTAIDGLDPSCLELYLTDADFVRSLGCDKEHFYRLHFWRQVRAKEEAGLW